MPDFPGKYRLTPKDSPETVSVTLPGSKSYTNRALLMAALAEGTSTLSNALGSDDTERMVECLNVLGVETSADRETNTIKVQGTGYPVQAPSEPLYCGNAGTAIRFLVPFCALGDFPVTLTGDDRMRVRPIGELLDGLRQLGGQAVDVDGTGCPPIRVEGGGLAGGACRIRGEMSSQYFSALLLSGARMRDGISIEVEGDLVSKPYIDMTLDVIEKFGVKTENEGYRRIAIPAEQSPRPADYVVEGDASAASYFFAAAAVTGTTVRVGPLPSESCQGDRDFVKVLEQMGCRWKQDGLDIELIGGPLRGIDADLNAMSDTAQTLAVVALFAEGPTTIRNIANVRVKETDRIAALNRELSRLGATVEEFSDGLTIHPSKKYKPAEIETYDDHRMAMSFAVAGTRLPGLVIKDPACVTKTFPNFFETFSPWVDVEAV